MKLSKGRILYFNSDCVYKSIGYELYKSSSLNGPWIKICSVKVGWASRLLSKLSWAKRLLRLGIYKLIKNDRHIILFSDKCIFKFDEHSSSLTRIGNVYGSRPLYPCLHKDTLYYGEYFSNNERRPVKIYKYSISDGIWGVVKELEGVRHIHGIFYDGLADRFWVTTGDLDSECKILYTEDEFETLVPFLEGLQQYRAIYLHFKNHSIIYGTDAPEQKNNIIEVDRVSKEIIFSCSVSGPIFYGARSGGTEILTTAVEPSEVNDTKNMEIWVATGATGWKVLKRIKKDFLPKKFFQYGHIALPEGDGVDGMIVYTPIAAQGHDYIHVEYISDV